MLIKFWLCVTCSGSLFQKVNAKTIFLQFLCLTLLLPNLIRRGMGSITLALFLLKEICFMQMCSRNFPVNSGSHRLCSAYLFLKKKIITKSVRIFFCYSTSTKFLHYSWRNYLYLKLWSMKSLLSNSMQISLSCRYIYKHLERKLLKEFFCKY